MLLRLSSARLSENWWWLNPFGRTQLQRNFYFAKIFVGSGSSGNSGKKGNAKWLKNCFHLKSKWKIISLLLLFLVLVKILFTKGGITKRVSCRRGTTVAQWLKQLLAALAVWVRSRHNSNYFSLWYKVTEWKQKARTGNYRFANEKSSAVSISLGIKCPRSSITGNV